MGLCWKQHRAYRKPCVLFPPDHSSRAWCFTDRHVLHNEPVSSGHSSSAVVPPLSISRQFLGWVLLISRYRLLAPGWEWWGAGRDTEQTTGEGRNLASLCVYNCWVSSTASEIPASTNTGADGHVKVIWIWLLPKFHIPLGSTGAFFPHDLISHTLAADSQASNVQFFSKHPGVFAEVGRRWESDKATGRAYRHAWVWASDPQTSHTATEVWNPDPWSYQAAFVSFHSSNNAQAAGNPSMWRTLPV